MLDLHSKRFYESVIHWGLLDLHDQKDLLVKTFTIFIKLPTCVCCWQPNEELWVQVHLCHSTCLGNQKEAPRTVVRHFQLLCVVVSSRLHHDQSWNRAAVSIVLEFPVSTWKCNGFISVSSQIWKLRAAKWFQFTDFEVIVINYLLMSTCTMSSYSIQTLHQEDNSGDPTARRTTKRSPILI